MGRNANKGKTVQLFDKTCNKCGCTKKSTEFYRDAGIADGHSTICKECKTEVSLKWRENNRAQYNATQRAYNAANYQTARIVRYGLTIEEYRALLNSQSNMCAICDKKPPGKRPLVIDHCHDTGKVRGLLCYGCNRIMHVVDNPELLAKALLYKNRS